MPKGLTSAERTSAPRLRKVSLSADQWSSLKLISRRDAVPIDTLIREAVDFFIRRKGSPR